MTGELTLIEQSRVSAIIRKYNHAWLFICMEL